MEEIKTFMYLEFSSFSISNVPRVCNVVADLPVAIGLNCMNGPLLWHDSVPDSVALLVTSDLPGTSD
jgi:hypothetical protein